MRTKAAIIREAGKPWEITELRDLPVLLDRAPEPVRLGRADDDRDAG
ncbi:MAG TPA: hypothetical protein VGG83_16300 [Trebonia sp.]